jgi:AraC family transcriptional regulator, positive regulator of tynA and feaB
MFQTQTISTDGVPPSRRLAYWNDLIGGTLIAQVADPADRHHFSGRMKFMELGDVRLAEIHAAASRVSRTASHVAHGSESVWLMRLQLAGSLTASYDQEEIHLRPGDFMLYDSSRPYRMLFHEPATVLALRIPQKTLLGYIPYPDRVACRVMSGASGASNLVSQFLQGFWQRCAEIHSEEVVSRLVDVALRLVASAFADLPQSRIERSSVVTAHRMRILQYIERHLREPDLTPTRVAAGLQMTPAYLHQILSDEPETASRYILRRRLEECARALADSLHRNRSVTDIALEYGFNSLSHFSRVFHAHHGLTPREYRQKHSPCRARG